MQTLTPLPRRQFGSDNFAGLAPEAWTALTAANASHAVSYGDDPWTARACDIIREVLEADAEVFFVFNGTAANSLALAHVCRPFHSIVCHRHAHVEDAECGAPEFFTGGSKLILLDGADGKLTPDAVERATTARSDFHYPKPGALTLTQGTEAGTVYSPEEIRALATVAHRHGMKVHLDGARFANALATLRVPPREITWQAGVDVMTFGSTKNGVAVGEAVVFFDRALAKDFDYRAKQAGQLASKLRFLTAPWVGLLESGAWLRHAAHANTMALRLEAGLRGLPTVNIAWPVQLNSVFLRVAPATAQALYDRGWMFFQLHTEPEYRIMCSWDTTAQDVDAFVADVKSVVGR